MIEAMNTYFSAESGESLLFVVVGVAAIGVSIGMLVLNAPLRAAAWPLIAVALIQLGVGGGVYLRTPAQVMGLKGQFATAPVAYHRAETQRMAVVMDKFSIYKTLELALLAVGAVCLALGRSQAAPKTASPNGGFAARAWADWRSSPARVHLFAIGLGLALQAGFMLVMDLFAEARAHDYLKALALMVV
jgi:hypothetical protein